MRFDNQAGKKRIPMIFPDKRPLVFFDLETTGTNLMTDRIVELSVVKLHPGGEKEIRTRRLNPEMHIPEEATAIHHISDADVADAPRFRQIAKNFYIFLEDCDLAGYNIIKFDLPMLTKEFQRTGLQFSLEGRRIIDAYSIFCRMEPRTLTAAYKLFCGKKLEDAHGAEADTMATLEVFKAQMERYGNADANAFPEGITEFPKTLDELHEFCNTKNPDWIDASGRFRWRSGEAVVSFGRYSGTPLTKIATDFPDFLQWILKADFPGDVKKIASDALTGKFPQKNTPAETDRTPGSCKI